MTFKQQIYLQKFAMLLKKAQHLKCKIYIKEEEAEIYWPEYDLFPTIESNSYILNPIDDIGRYARRIKMVTIKIGDIYAKGR